jgi:hypothetical protein
MKGWEEILEKNSIQMQAGVPILIPNKADFKQNLQETKKIISY